jgi:EmrB/QacA subfamily drug resistance transporter
VSTSTGDETAPEIDYSKKWYSMAAVGVGVLLATIDGSIVNVALPTIRTQLDATLPVVQWVSVGYLLTLASLTLSVGRWGDIVGKKRIYVWGFILFTIASVLCGVAPSIEFLIGFRVLQALGAVMVLALGASILTEAFPPHERGKALGLIGTFVSVGIVSGPVLGGVLIEAFDWRAIFFVNLPVGLIGTIIAIKYVPATPPPGGQTFDVRGSITLTASLACIALAVTAGQELGYGSGLIVAGLLAGLTLGGVFILIERTAPSPMIDLTMFRNPVLTVSVVSGYLVYGALSGVFFLLPFYLEGVLGYNTRQTGLALGIAPLILGLVAPIAGTLSDRLGIRRITMIGLLILGLSYGAFYTLSTETTFMQYVLIAIPIGVGFGMFQSPNNSAIMGSVAREHSGVAGGLLTLTRLLGQVTGIAVLGSFWAARVSARADGPILGDAVTALPDIQVAALHDTALVMAALSVVAILIGAWGLRQERQG